MVLWNGNYELSNVTIEWNLSRDYQQGIEIINANWTMDNVNIEKTKWNGDDAWAILLYGNWSANITNSTISNSEWGVWIWVVAAAWYPDNIAWTITLWAWNNFVADDKWKIGIDWNKERLNEAGRIQVVYDAIKQIQNMGEVLKWVV